jgi:hypothetical protein
MNKSILILVVFITLNVTLFGQSEVSFETLTEALEDVFVNRYEVKKLIIMGEIAGNNYVDSSSEWRLIRILDEWFPSLEALELWTDQDIPDVDVVFQENGYTIKTQIGLFYAQKDGNKSAEWIKHFSAPNIKYIGDMAFGISSIESVYFPSVTEVGDYVFAFCDYLTHIKEEDFASLIMVGHGMFYSTYYAPVSVSFPKAEIIGCQAFYRCRNLTEIHIPEVREIWGMALYMTNLVSIDLPKAKIFYGGHNLDRNKSLMKVSIGTGFEEDTEIEFDLNVFGLIYEGSNIPGNIDLTLGKYVLPKPIGNAWQKVAINEPLHAENNVDYIWKSINVLGIAEEEEMINIYNINKNIYYIDTDISDLTLELYSLDGHLLKNINEKIIDLNDYNLLTGFYLLNLIDNKKLKLIKTYKIIIN